MGSILGIFDLKWLKLIKSRSGLADVLNKENTRFLRKLENIIPEIHYYLEEVEDEVKTQGHKETKNSFVKSYINDVRMVRRRISINLFLEKGARKVTSTMSMPACVKEDMEKSISDRQRTVRSV